MNGLSTCLRAHPELRLRSHDPYDITYLTGGHIRVADTAVVALSRPSPPSIGRGPGEVRSDSGDAVLRPGASAQAWRRYVR
jgi:hypothetical protein